MIRFKQLIGLFVLGILHLGCDADQLREKRIQKARFRRQGDLNEWRILSSKKVSPWNNYHYMAQFDIYGAIWQFDMVFCWQLLCRWQTFMSNLIVYNPLRHQSISETFKIFCQSLLHLIDFKQIEQHQCWWQNVLMTSMR